MADPRLVRLADTLVNYSVEVKPGDWVLIRGDVVSEPLVVEVVRAVMEAGGLPDINLSSDDITEAYLRGANEEQLKWVSPVSKLLFNEADVLIALRGVSNTRSLTNIDPQNNVLGVLPTAN